jgi:uncharacterized protein YpiB (UPF0302 family)
MYVHDNSPSGTCPTNHTRLHDCRLNPSYPHYIYFGWRHASNQKEEYETQLERMNNAMSTENQGLQHDNKQLNALIKEYEQTLDTLMSE